MTDELGRMALMILGEMDRRGGSCTAEVLREDVVRACGRRWMNGASVTFRSALVMLLERGELSRLSSPKGFDADLFRLRAMPLADPGGYVYDGYTRRHIGLRAKLTRRTQPRDGVLDGV